MQTTEEHLRALMIDGLGGCRHAILSSSGQSWVYGMKNLPVRT
jgi:hypothetical protein